MYGPRFQGVNPRTSQKLFAATNPNSRGNVKRWASRFNFLGYRVLEHPLATEGAQACVRRGLIY
jgi:hypothetical protein